MSGLGGLAQFALVATLCALLVWAAASDMQRYLIPNRICLSLLVLYPGYAVGLTPAEIGIAAVLEEAAFGLLQVMGEAADLGGEGRAGAADFAERARAHENAIAW